MSVRNGTQFIARLKERPREVWIDGERVDDVAAHPAFAASARQLANLYDLQSDPAHRDTLTYAVDASGKTAGTAFMPSKDSADLLKRRNAFRIWAEATFGLMGRSPDFLNTTLLAFAEAKHVFGRGGAQYADNISRYYEYVRDNDLFLSHALVTPQNDRSKASSEQSEPMHLRVVKETSAGIVVSGARMLATLGPIADEMIMYNLPTFTKGDDDYALAFAVPTETEGLRQICREAYDTGGRSSFDHPLASRFEESDALLIFKDVFVPWERVFIYRDVPLCNAVYVDTALRNHTAHQTNVRAWVKMQFAVGLAIAVARSIKADQFLHVQQMLGECLGYVEFVRSALVCSEAQCEPTGVGTVRASLPPLQAIRTLLPRVYPRVIEVLQTVGAGGLMMMPSGADFENADIAADVDFYYQGAGQMPSVERIKLFKLAWDLAGDAFGSRQLQYERYYAGDPVRLLAGNYLGCDDREMMKLVDAAKALAGAPGARADVPQSAPKLRRA
ncbi:MAG: 4-hydroxyphenylacetate 3-hydroxylase family protein [Alphaproteobacteria bacterium]